MMMLRRMMVHRPLIQQISGFVISTAIGTLLFFIVFDLVFSWFQTWVMFSSKPESAFPYAYALAYLLSVVWQHALNRKLIPSNAIEPFIPSLVKAYVIYSVSLLSSCLLGLILVPLLQLGPNAAALLTLGSSGLINFVLISQAKHLSRLMFSSKKKERDSFV